MPMQLPGVKRNLKSGKFLVKLPFGLREKLILSYLVVLMIPAVILALYISNNIRSSAIKDELEKNKQLLDKARVNIDRNIDICRSAVESVTREKKLADFLLQEEDVPVRKLLEFKDDAFDSLQNLVYINRNINMIRIFVENENLVDFRPVVFCENQITHPGLKKHVGEVKGWFKTFGNKELWLTDNPDHASAQEGIEPVMLASYFREYYDRFNRYVGLVEVNMLKTVFFSDIYEFEDPEDTLLCIIRGDGENILNGTNGFVSHHGITLEDTLSYLKSREFDSEEGHFLASIGKEQLLVVYSSLNLPDHSRIFRVISLNSILAKSNKTRNEVILVIFAGVLILSAMTYLTTTVLFRKMKTIITLMRRVQEGNLEVEIPVGGRDEIGELAHHFRIMMRKVNELITMVFRKQTAAKDAEIRALHAQINAHFIYNVLETIRMMAIVEKKPQIADVVLSLGSMMRYSMAWSKQFVPLEMEIDNIRNYIHLVEVRYDFEIRLAVDMDKPLMNYEILKMTLQPIVENSFNHGIEPYDRDGLIRIEACIEEAFLLIHITDNGMGIAGAELEQLNRLMESGGGEEPNPSKGNGIGLKNVNDRIRLFYGQQYGLQVTSKFSEFTRVTLRLPNTGITGR